VNGLYDGQISSRLDRPNAGGLLIIAHRLNELDLTGHLLQQGGWRQITLPFKARGTRKYKLSNGKTWTRKKGDLLRPQVFDRQHVKTITKSRDYEALYQQNPGGDVNLRIKREHFTGFAKDILPPSPVVVLSVDPGQKGGPTHSCSVIQAWMAIGENYFLLDQWRQRASYTELRKNVRKFIKRFRPSLILIEATGQGPSLEAEVRPQHGMHVQFVTPVGPKVERLRRHRKLIRKRRIHIPERAFWREEFLDELTLFPNAGADDQVDALTQYLDYATGNPPPPARPPRPLGVGVGSDGRAIVGAGPKPVMEIPGGVLPGKVFRRPW
jgi:predicted phage terminase large subunit-like protein